MLGFGGLQIEIFQSSGGCGKSISGVFGALVLGGTDRIQALVRGY